MMQPLISKRLAVDSGVTEGSAEGSAVIGRDPPGTLIAVHCCIVFAMPWFKLLHAVVVFFIGAFALYWGITGKDIYPRGSRIPLPKTLGRVVCFLVAGVAIYFLSGDCTELWRTSALAP